MQSCAAAQSVVCRPVGLSFELKMVAGISSSFCEFSKLIRFVINAMKRVSIFAFFFLVALARRGCIIGKTFIDEESLILT